MVGIYVIKKKSPRRFSPNKKEDKLASSTNIFAQNDIGGVEGHFYAYRKDRAISILLISLRVKVKCHLRVAILMNICCQIIFKNCFF